MLPGLKNSLTLKQGKSLQTFESDITQAHLNGVDVGDINHSRKFAAGLDRAIYETMKDALQKNMNTVLDATNNERPAGIVFDKMTPNKRTGQIHGLSFLSLRTPLVATWWRHSCWMSLW